jgi:hypothetical protein
MTRFGWGMRLSLNAHVLTIAFYFSTTCDISSTALTSLEVHRNLLVGEEVAGEEVVGEEVWVGKHLQELLETVSRRQKASRFWTQSLLLYV